MKKGKSIKLDNREIEDLITLARLNLKDDEIESIKHDLLRILEYVENIKEVDISNVLPTFHPLNSHNIQRKDEAKEESLKMVEKLLKLVPKKFGRYVKFEKIL